MRAWRNNLLALTLIVLAGAAVNSLRAPLVARFLSTKVRDDVFALPPPNQVAVLSLGYRAALADLIFAHVLVASGIHMSEKRPFEFAGKYLETVNELDPKFEAPYRMTDGLLTLQAKRVPPESYRQARRILERGMRELPFNQALWASAGQFFAYLGPSIFSDPAEQNEWRLAGGRTLARACELVGSDENIPYHCVVAAGLLTQSGANEASREFLERMLITNDDPEIRRLVMGTLERVTSEEDRKKKQLRREAFQKAWTADLPFVSRALMATLSPSWDAAACASPGATCPTSWRAWGKSQAHLPDTTPESDHALSGSQ